MVKRITGTYNAGCRNSISKAEFALNLAKRLNLSTKEVSIEKLNNLTLKAKRPLDMTLDVRKIETALGTSCPDIFDQIELTYQEYRNA